MRSSCEFLRKQSLEGSTSIQQYNFIDIVYTYPQADEQENGHNSYFRTWILSSTHYFATETSIPVHIPGLSLREEFYTVIVD